MLFGIDHVDGELGVENGVDETFLLRTVVVDVACVVLGCNHGIITKGQNGCS